MRGRGQDAIRSLLRSDYAALRLESSLLDKNWHHLLQTNQMSITLPQGLDAKITRETEAFILEMEKFGDKIHRQSRHHLRDQIFGKRAKDLLDQEDKLDQDIQTYVQQEYDASIQAGVLKLAPGSDEQEIERLGHGQLVLQRRIDAAELARDKVHQELAPYLAKAYRDVVGKIKPLGHMALSSVQTDKHFHDLYQKNTQHFPHTWLKRIENKPMTIQKVYLAHDDGQYHPPNKILIGREARYENNTLIHEMAHHMSHHHSQLRSLAWAYRNYRTQFLGDDCLANYAYKQYATSHGLVPETEIVSCGAAAMSGEDPRLWRAWYQDTEYRNFYLGLVASVS